MFCIKINPVFCLILALFIALGVWGYFMWASYGQLPQKVADIQKEIELLKAPTDSSKTKSLNLQKLEHKIDKVETSIRSDFFLLQKLGIPLTVIAFTLLFWSVYKSALGLALNNAKATIDKYYLPDEERFKLEKKVLILTKGNGDTSFIRKLLHDTGFLATATIPKENVKALDEETLIKTLNGQVFDLILFNNETVPFTNDEIRLCQQRTPAFTMLFSFGNPATDDPKVNKLLDDLVSLPRVASANFKSQIYGNLINALKYQQYLRNAAQGRQT